MEIEKGSANENAEIRRKVFSGGSREVGGWEICLLALRFGVNEGADGPGICPHPVPARRSNARARAAGPRQTWATDSESRGGG